MIQYKAKKRKKSEGVRMNEKKPAVGILTLGCKVNQYESEAAAEGTPCSRPRSAAAPTL